MWSVQKWGHVTISPCTSEVSQQYQATLETQQYLLRAQEIHLSNLVKHNLLLKRQLTHQKPEDESTLLYLLTLQKWGIWSQSFAANCRLVLQLSHFHLQIGMCTQLFQQALGFLGTSLVADLGLVASTVLHLQFPAVSGEQKHINSLQPWLTYSRTHWIK